MGSFSKRAAAIATDPRRAYRMAERMAALADPLGQSTIPPGGVTADHASLNQLIASGVNFDRAGFAYDITTTSNYTVNGSSTTPTSWTRACSQAGNLRLGLGAISEPVYVWIWGGFSWANNGTGADGRVVACLYDSFAGVNPPIVRASNIANTRMLNDNVFRQVVYMGFIAIDEAILDGTVGIGLTDLDWNIGLQQQLAGAQQATTQSGSRQSLIAFVSSFPPDGVGNYTVDLSLA